MKGSPMRTAFVHILLSLLTLSGLKAAHNKQLGRLEQDRSAFDVLHYGISLKVYPKYKRIAGSNHITLRMLEDADRLRFDLAENMHLDSIKLNGSLRPFVRKSARIYLKATATETKPVFQKDSLLQVTLFFSGKPLIARWPPWDGGFVWSVDGEGNPWVGLACESIGPSVWLPCKDHWSDEPDSMDMHLTVPAPLTGVSNGKLQSVTYADSGCRTFHWQVLNPINAYNISVNAAVYAHISDTFEGIHRLPLDYYVLSRNEFRARAHFTATEPMLRAFEHYFGPYPFTADGYKLVETPYWGMEHQSCVAYGNNYKLNTWGFDFILVHESGHEWFANSITAADPADMWIHESFTTYSEALYLEYTQSKVRAQEYLLEQKKKIVSKRPLQGPRDVYYHNHKDNDIYYKGSWMLHSMRSVLNNDTLWFAALRDLNAACFHRVVGTEEVCRFLSARTRYNWDLFFNQYIYTADLPELHIQKVQSAADLVTYRLWLKRIVHGLELPLNLNLRNGSLLQTTLSENPVQISLPAYEELKTLIEAKYLLKIKMY